jgi:hypothetical protein
MGKKHSYRIVGYKRGGGTQEVYNGTDWSMVSDEMANNGDPDPNYGRMELYQDGQLVETAETSLPERRRGLLSWLLG